MAKGVRKELKYLAYPGIEKIIVFRGGGSEYGFWIA
jgi:hypothetical protein